MRVAVDLENLRFTHVHPVADIVHGLVYLEGAKLKHVAFENTDRPGFLDGMTTLELNLLYRNTTGQDFPPNTDDLTRREVLASLVDAMEPRKVIEAELDAQIAAVEENLEAPIETAIQYRYVLGARVPRVEDGGLFPVTAAPANAAQLAQAATAAPQRRTVRAAPTAPAPRETRPTRPAAAPRAFSGSTRPVIFAHADKVWEEAGKPTDKAVVLELRKRMMSELEEKGIKRTTSSTALGDWMKQRIS